MPFSILIGGDNILKLTDFGISPPVHSYSMELLKGLKFVKVCFLLCIVSISA